MSFPQGRPKETIEIIEEYLKRNQLFRDYADPSQDPAFSEVGMMKMKMMVVVMMMMQLLLLLILMTIKILWFSLLQEYSTNLDCGVGSGSGGTMLFRSKETP